MTTQQTEPSEYKLNTVCTKCVMDLTVSGIEFDDNRICNFCKLHETLEKKFPIGKKGKNAIDKLMNTIKRRGEKKKYDCIVGISGGVDSTYIAFLAKKWGLRVLAVHLDNGWNSKEAEHNIQIVADKLYFDLRIEKVNWDEFRKLQIAFLKASVPDIEIPTDVGIYSTLYKVAAEEKIPSILNGHSFRQEGTSPISWSYMEGKYIDSVYKEFTGKKLKYFNNIKVKDMLYYSLFKGIKVYSPLEYIDYDKKQAGEVLKDTLSWKDYGGHHFESIYTRFVSSYILPTKFNIDKRKVSLSAKVRSGKLSRKEALKILDEEYYPPKRIKKDKEAVLDRIGINDKEFEQIMISPIKSYNDYKTYLTTIKRFKFFIKIACKLKLLPEILYEKYAK